MTTDPPIETKAELRERGFSLRAAISDATREDLSRRLRDQGVRLAGMLEARVVSAFYPIRDEPDTMPLLAALAALGVGTALPVTGARSSPLKFRLWKPGDPTVAGPMNIPEPTPEAKIVDPDLVVVPLAVFDRRGHRIGYGAGYYDRTLTDLRARKPIRSIGVGYAACEIERVPDEPHDIVMDFIVTEKDFKVPADSF